MRDVAKMTRQEFEELPERKNWNEKILCDYLIILPSRRLHSSGYRCIDFVAVSQESMIRLSGCSDVMHVDGIGGFGHNWLKKYGTCPSAIHPVGWQIDSLKKSGLLRIFAHSYSILCGAALSSFEFWAVPKEEESARRAKYERSAGNA